MKPLGLWAGGFLPVVLLLGCCFGAKAQVNLIQNPSFEDISGCPAYYNQINLALGWDTLKSGGGGAPEVFNACANPSIHVGVPLNVYGSSYQKTVTGNGYGYLGLYINPSFFNQREYIQNTLLKPLEVGKTYCVTFFVSLSNRSQYAIDQLGAYFDYGSISTVPYGVSTLNPQVKSVPNLFYSDTLHWMKVQGSFTALGAYTYLTLGNFRSNAATNKILVNANSQELAEYYIDDVSVIEINTPASAGRDTTICKTDSAFIGRPNEIGLDCEWYVGNTLIGSGSGIWVKPQATTSYVVKQDICGIISYDTVTVAVRLDDCYNTEVVIPNVFTPNDDGINDTWYIDIRDASNISYSIYNRWGNTIKQFASKSQSTVLWDGKTTPGEPCPDGVYYYIVEYTDGKEEIKKRSGYISLIR